MEKLKQIYVKNKEVINYLIFGVLTTIVSILTFYICTKFLDSNNSVLLQISNCISWFVSVTFAYVTNKNFVFEDKQTSFEKCLKFYISRLATLFLEMGIMYIGVSSLGINDMVVKIIAQILVVVLNYVISKIFVFTNKNTKKS